MAMQKEFHRDSSAITMGDCLNLPVFIPGLVEKAFLS